MSSQNLSASATAGIAPVHQPFAYKERFSKSQAESLASTTPTLSPSASQSQSSLKIMASPSEETLTMAPPTFIGWDGPDDPDNPQNWSYLYKFFSCAIILYMAVVA